MTEENPLIPGVDPAKQPHKSLLKRIDIGLLTAILALLISFIGIITAYAAHQLEEKTQKAEVLPIIDIDLGYLGKTCLLYTSPSPRDQRGSRMPSSA